MVIEICSTSICYIHCSIRLYYYNVSIAFKRPCILNHMGNSSIIRYSRFIIHNHTKKTHFIWITNKNYLQNQRHKTYINQPFARAPNSPESTSLKLRSHPNEPNSNTPPSIALLQNHKTQAPDHRTNSAVTNRSTQPTSSSIPRIILLIIGATTYSAFQNLHEVTAVAGTALQPPDSPRESRRQATCPLTLALSTTTTLLPASASSCSSRSRTYSMDRLTPLPLGSLGLLQEIHWRYDNLSPSMLSLEDELARASCSGVPWTRWAHTPTHAYVRYTVCQCPLCTCTGRSRERRRGERREQNENETGPGAEEGRGLRCTWWLVVVGAVCVCARGSVHLRARHATASSKKSNVHCTGRP